MNKLYLKIINTVTSTNSAYIMSFTAIYTKCFNTAKHKNGNSTVVEYLFRNIQMKLKTMKE